MNEAVLGHFFNYKRTHLNPADYGIEVTSRRRTAGLRRDEVADRAHFSLDWYTRIEQGRNDANPSPEILTALCEVLRLTPAEVQYVFHLTDKVVPDNLQNKQSLSNSLQKFLDQQLPNPAFVTDKFLTITAWNSSFTRLYGDLTNQSALQRNVIWRTFNVPTLRNLFTDWSVYASQQTAQFRQIYSAAASDPFLWQVFTAVRDDQNFKETWDQLTVQGFPDRLFLLNHPQLGPLYLQELTFKTAEGLNYVVIQSGGDTDSKRVLADL